MIVDRNEDEEDEEEDEEEENGKGEAEKEYRSIGLERLSRTNEVDIRFRKMVLSRMKWIFPRLLLSKT